MRMSRGDDIYENANPDPALRFQRKRPSKSNLDGLASLPRLKPLGAVPIHRRAARGPGSIQRIGGVAVPRSVITFVEYASRSSFMFEV